MLNVVGNYALVMFVQLWMELKLQYGKSNVDVGMVVGVSTKCSLRGRCVKRM